MYSDFTVNKGVSVHFTEEDESNNILVSTMPDTILNEPFYLYSYKTQDLLDVLENKNGHTDAFHTFDCNCHSYIKRALKQMPLCRPSYNEIKKRLYKRD